jgi:hypothetical protein
MNSGKNPTSYPAFPIGMGTPYTIDYLKNGEKYVETIVLKQIEVPIAELLLGAKNELGQEEKRQGSGYIGIEQSFRPDYGAGYLFQLFGSYAGKIDNGVGNFEEIIGNEQVPGQTLPFTKPEKQVDADQ